MTDRVYNALRAYGRWLRLDKEAESSRDRFFRETEGLTDSERETLGELMKERFQAPVSQTSN